MAVCLSLTDGHTCISQNIYSPHTRFSCAGFRIIRQFFARRGARLSLRAEQRLAPLLLEAAGQRPALRLFDGPPAQPARRLLQLRRLKHHREGELLYQNSHIERETVWVIKF